MSNYAGENIQNLTINGELALTNLPAESYVVLTIHSNGTFDLGSPKYTTERNMTINGNTITYGSSGNSYSNGAVLKGELGGTSFIFRNRCNLRVLITNI